MTVFASPELTNLQQAHKELADVVANMFTKAANAERRLRDLEDVVLTLDDRLRDLEEPKPKAKPRDDTNERILTYLRETVPGLWQTPATIAANLDLDNTSVADRLFRLARNGTCGLQVRGGKGTGQHPQYRIVPEPQLPEA